MTVLDGLLTDRRADVEREKRERPAASLQALASAHRRRPFKEAVRRRPADPLRVIAEFKRGSPSAGLFAADADAAAQARAYERGGASAISVLTEGRHFHGGFADLRAVRAAVSLPVLCKDIVVDDYQVWEAAAEGADAVLLIAAVLDDGELARLLALAASLDMDALVEVHDAREAERAIAAGATLVGANNRDLRTFAVDTGTALDLRPRLGGVVTVAESGYRSYADVRACEAAGFDAVLIGERVMRSDDPVATIRALRGDG